MMYVTYVPFQVVTNLVSRPFVMNGLDTRLGCTRQGRRQQSKSGEALINIHDLNCTTGAVVCRRSINSRVYASIPHTVQPGCLIN